MEINLTFSSKPTASRSSEGRDKHNDFVKRRQQNRERKNGGGKGGGGKGGGGKGKGKPAPAKKPPAPAAKKATSDDVSMSEGGESDGEATGMSQNGESEEESSDVERDEVIKIAKPRGAPTKRTVGHANLIAATKLTTAPFKVSKVIEPPSPPPSLPPSPEDKPAEDKPQYVAKKRTAARTGIITREGIGGVYLRKLPDDESAFYKINKEEISVDCGTKVDIIDEMAAINGVAYLLVNQFTEMLSDGSTPHGWIKADYIVEEL